MRHRPRIQLVQQLWWLRDTPDPDTPLLLPLFLRCSEVAIIQRVPTGLEPQETILTRRLHPLPPFFLLKWFPMVIDTALLLVHSALFPPGRAMELLGNIRLDVRSPSHYPRLPILFVRRPFLYKKLLFGLA